MTCTSAASCSTSHHHHHHQLLDRHGAFTLLHQCTNSTRHLKQAHGRILRAGLGDDPQILTKLLRLTSSSSNCCNPSSMRYASVIFRQISEPDAFVFNIMIRRLTLCGNPSEALHFYNFMLRRNVPPDQYSFPFGLKACIESGTFGKGKELHARSIKAGLDTDTFVVNSLLNLYLEFGESDCAHQLFDEMPERNIVSWTTMISGLVKSGDLQTSRLLFERMPERNVVSWTAIMSGYVRDGHPEEALELFHRMVAARVRPNEFTLVVLLSACAELGSLSLGRWVHEYIEESGFLLSVFLGTGLIDMYSKCGCLDLAVQVFQSMSERNVVTWNAMITSLGVHGRGEVAVEVFKEMEKVQEVKPDTITFVGVLCACLNAGLVEEGCKYLQTMGEKYGVLPTIEHYGYVIDMLCRTGRVEEAREILLELPIEHVDSIWGWMRGDAREGAFSGELELAGVVRTRMIKDIGRYRENSRSRREMEVG